MHLLLYAVHSPCIFLVFPFSKCQSFQKMCLSSKVSFCVTLRDVAVGCSGFQQDHECLQIHWYLPTQKNPCFRDLIQYLMIPLQAEDIFTHGSFPVFPCEIPVKSQSNQHVNLFFSWLHYLRLTQVVFFLHYVVQLSSVSFQRKKPPIPSHCPLKLPMRSISST